MTRGISPLETVSVTSSKEGLSLQGRFTFDLDFQIFEDSSKCILSFTMIFVPLPEFIVKFQRLRGSNQLKIKT